MQLVQSASEREFYRLLIMYQFYEQTTAEPSECTALIDLIDY